MMLAGAAATMSRGLRRRDALAGMLAATAVVSGRVSAASLTIGQAEILVATDGTLSVPLSFLLPETSAADLRALLVSAGMSPDGGPTPMNVAIVRTGGEVVLVDAGAGGRYQDTAGRLADNLAALGIRPEDVTRVVITHGHADHLWGVVDEFDDSLRFPNATYVVPAAEWDFWTRSAASGAPAWLAGMVPGSDRAFRAIEGRTERRRDGETVGPGLTYLATPGHTPGHMSVLVSSAGRSALIGGDALSHPAVSFRHPDWRYGSDLDRDGAAATRRKLLDRLATEQMPLVGYHLSGSGLGRVERADGAYRFIPA